MVAAEADDAVLGRYRSTMESLAWAVCPPEGLTDELVSATIDDASAMVGVLARPMRRALLLVAAMLEQGPRTRGGRPFSVLDPVDARRALARLSRGPLSQAIRLLRDLVVVSYYEQPAVRDLVGYLPDPFIAERRVARLAWWSDDVAAHQALLVAPDPLRDDTTRARRQVGSIRHGRDLVEEPVDCDVVIVGSGAGGGVMAAELAEAGLAVVVLEEGDHHATESFTTSTTRALRTLYRNGGATATIGKTPIGYAEGRCVGGGTVVNGGMSFRASDRVLDRWATLAGDRSLSGGGLDDAYARVERFLSVGVPDPGSVGRDQDLLRLGAERMGWRVIDDLRNHVHCGGCNVCTWGCPTGAKQSTLVSYLPRAVAFGAMVRSACRVDRVMMAGKRAVGVKGHVVGVGEARPERTFEVRARHVVLCAGALESPALLARSGLRSPSGQIGRNLALHPGAAVAAVFDHDVLGWQGAHQALQVREFEDEGVVLAAVNLPPSLVAMALSVNGGELADAMAGYNQMVTAGSIVEDTGRGRVRVVGADTVVPTYQLSARDADLIGRSVLWLSEAMLAAGAHTVHLPFAGRAPLHSGDDLRRARAIPVAAADMRLSTVHLMGTNRMGSDPMWAVCDPFGSVHDTVGLSVADASLFPGPLGVNPMLTIQALATRGAGRIIDTW